MSHQSHSSPYFRRLPREEAENRNQSSPKFTTEETKRAARATSNLPPPTSQVGVDSPAELWILSPTPGGFSTHLAGFLPNSGKRPYSGTLRRWTGLGARWRVARRTSGPPTASARGLGAGRISIGCHFGTEVSGRRGRWGRLGRSPEVQRELRRVSEVFLADLGTTLSFGCQNLEAGS